MKTIVPVVLVVGHITSRTGFTQVSEYISLFLVLQAAAGAVNL